MATKAKDRPVLVTTEYRAVMFGYTTDSADAVTVTLKRFRNCIYWDVATGGVFGLAEKGPTKGCKIGLKVEGPTTLQKVTSVTEVSPAAVDAWESAASVS
jgi:hypothetical protein